MAGPPEGDSPVIAAGTGRGDGPASNSHQEDKPPAAAAAPHEMATPSAFQAINRPSSTEQKIVKNTNERNGLTAIPAEAPAAQQAQSIVTDALSNDAENPASPVDTQEELAADTGTYGTRSRNRTGAARPNYSEDQEYDYDFVSSAATTTTNSANGTTLKKTQQSATLPNGQSNSDAKRAKELSQVIGANEKSASAQQSTPTATTAATPSANSKKRKATGTLSAQNATPPTANTPTAGAMRKAATLSNASARETNMMSFIKSKAFLNKKNELVSDDGAKLAINDHVYLVCEPPGDPYYLCRIMEFLHVKSDDPTSPVDSLRVNWYYRPRDVQRFNNDSRLVYATMHSDLCPLTSLRGKCTIKHRSEINDLDGYRKERDSFYFTQVFDRFIRRWYECIPTSAINNVPEKVKKALDERWKFVAVEIGRVKELTSAVKTCKRCAKYAASQDSVDCAICASSYHMNCVQPPLPKKPSRGFAWACGPCSRASERKMEARNTPTLSGDVTEAEEEVVEEEEAAAPPSNESTRAPSPSGSAPAVDDHPATVAEIALAKMWPMRYLGIHCRVEDALQYDDRAIYPRASSRLGPRHQANVSMWHGQAVELVKPAEIKKRYLKGNTQKKEGKLSKETIAALEADRVEKAKRPKWVQDEPPGYVARGEDYPNDDPRCTAKLLFKMPSNDDKPESGEKPVDWDRQLTKYWKQAIPMARTIGVPHFGANFLDKIAELYTSCNYDKDKALAKLAKVDRVKDLHEPVLSKADLAKFEEGVAKYGSEHRLIRLHMKTALSHADIVRFYYLWKKTPKGKEIWGNYPGRKGKKRLENDAAARLHDEVAHDADDSAFDDDKASKHKRFFQCKFCNTVTSRQWRRAPGASPGQTILSDARTGNKDKRERLLVALCLRCASLWRKYAIQWEDIDEVTKKVAAGSGRAWKKRIDEELLRELLIANEAASATPEPQTVVSIADGGIEPPKKKSKTDAALASEQGKKKEKLAPPPKPPTPEPPPIIPTQPVWRALPCSVCDTVGDTVACAHCRLTVHPSCYGFSERDIYRVDGESHWICDLCQNDRNPVVSTEHSCCLCLTEVTDVDLVETPRSTHRKKSDRDREKERLEKELADGMRADYKSRQLSHNRPPLPREPLKKTAGNNWVHVYCAVWTPEIRFSNSKALEVAEGFQLIPPARHEAVCKLCKNKDHQNKVRNDKGACVSCFQCQAPVHVSCAFEAGYQFGFDVTPVKSSRKDQITTATLGAETGSLTAAIWCKEHVVKTIIHPMHEIADDTGRTALQVYVENYKQADLTLTGTVRKAQLAQLTKDKGQQTVQPVQSSNRRESAAHSIAAAVRRGARTSTVSDVKQEDGDGAIETSEHRDASPERRCTKCLIDVTPKWHVVEKETPTAAKISPHSAGQRQRSMTRGEGRDPFIDDRQRQTVAVDITGAPTLNRHFEPSRSQQHIRFMPAGSNGRTWDGLHGRLGPGPPINGESKATEPMQIDSVGPSIEHATPQTSGGTEATYLCHKCFLKKKLDPTPPPPEPPTRMDISPPTQFPVRPEWNGAPPTSHQQQQLPQQTLPRSPWEDPTRSSQAGPPPPPPPLHPSGQPTSINGYAPSPAYVQQPAPHPPHNFPPSYHQPNGYHPPGPHPPSMHDSRPPAFSYPSQPPPNPQVFPSRSPSRPPPLNGFPTVSQALANGVNSPRPPPHAPLQSPTYPPPHRQYTPRRTTSPFSNQLPSLGPPANSNPSPNLPLTRPESIAQPNGLPAGVPQSVTPVISQAQPTGPPTPRDSQANNGRATSAAPPNGPGGSVGGASASPSVRNLLL